MSGLKIRGFPDKSTPKKIDLEKKEDGVNIVVSENDPVSESEKSIQAEPEKPKRTRTRKKPYENENKEAERISKLSPIERLEFALQGVKGAPSRATLEEWKALHGKFYMSSIDGDNVFIWKTIKRIEYKQLLNTGAMEKQNLLEDFIIRRCLLWPKPTPDFMSGSDAGVISTLFKQIYFQSGFIPEDLAFTLIEKI